MNKYNHSELEQKSHPPYQGLSVVDGVLKNIASLPSLGNKRMEYPEFDSNKSPEFPINVFPDKIQAVINANHKAFQLPKDYDGMGILVASAGAIGNSHCLEYKTGYRVPPIIYGAIVGNSSIGKTPALKRSLKPIIDLEKRFQKEWESKTEEWRKKVIAYKSTQKNSNFDDPGEKPIRKDLMIADATTEAINRAQSNNPRGLILFQDELLAWILNLNQYRAGSDLEYWLSNWSNSTAKVNRASKDTIFIEKPSVSVIGGIQPGVLDVLANGRKKDNGFLPRILFAYPDKSDKPKESDYEVSTEIMDMYAEIIYDLYKIGPDFYEDNEQSPIVIRMTDEAKDTFRSWADKNTEQINKVDIDSLKSLYGKMENYCLRFSLILHLMEKVCAETKSEDVEAETIRKAISLTEYFSKMGEKILRIVNKENPLERYSEQRQKIYEQLPDDFTTGQGVAIAAKFEMKERTFKSFLKEKGLFCKRSHGNYSKEL